MRLIDADAFKKALKMCKTKTDIEDYDDGYSDAILDVHIELKDAPTVMYAEPMRQGKWVQRNNEYYGCSECGHLIETKELQYSNFCPYCGAKMDKQQFEHLSKECDRITDEWIKLGNKLRGKYNETYQQRPISSVSMMINHTHQN